MAVGVAEPDPLTANRAVMEIKSAKVVDSQYRDHKNREQMQFETELEVLSGAGERNGERFREWFSFPAYESITPGSKTGQMLVAALKGDATAETYDDLAEKLIGSRFAAQIGLSKNGDHSRVLHDSIFPAPGDDGGSGGDGNGSGSPNGGGGLREAQQQASEAANTGDDIEEEFNRIPF